jgi:predicted RNase H-like HicB family nuclease
MPYHVGLEDIEPRNWVAWVFEWPGCYSRGVTREEAIDGAPRAIEELLRRLHESAFSVPESVPPIDVDVAEEFHGITQPDGYIVNAFFADDQVPVREWDIEYGRHLLGLNRRELEAISSDLPSRLLDTEILGEVQKTIRGILSHIGTAEWWYWDRLGLAFPRPQRPFDVIALLKKVREYTLISLPKLIGSELTTVCSGETWSPRKLVRRAIWHERVHTLQIIRYLRSIQAT